MAEDVQMSFLPMISSLLTFFLVYTMFFIFYRHEIINELKKNILLYFIFVASYVGVCSYLLSDYIAYQKLHRVYLWFSYVDLQNTIVDINYYSLLFLLISIPFILILERFIPKFNKLLMRLKQLKKRLSRLAILLVKYVELFSYLKAPC